LTNPHLTVGLEVFETMKNKFQKNMIILIIIVLASGIISACGPKEPAVDIDAQKTGFAQTANVQATMTAEAQPTATETLEPTATFTATPEYTPTLAVTATKSAPTTSNPSSGGDAAQWLANDPPDNTIFKPGEEFTVTWTLENTGTPTWTTNYYIKFYSGEQMDAEDKVFLPYPVPPGTNVQVSVDFVATESEGSKRSDWILKNANDETFYSFYIVIEVSESNQAPASPTNTPTATTAP